jgi:hypothetical protein
MTELIETAPDGPRDEVLKHVTAALGGIPALKRRAVSWKLFERNGSEDTQSAAARRMIAPSERG